MKFSSENPFVGPVPKTVHLPNTPLASVLVQVRFPEVLSIAKTEFIADFQERIRADYPANPPTHVEHEAEFEKPSSQLINLQMSVSAPIGIFALKLGLKFYFLRAFIPFIWHCRDRRNYIKTQHHGSALLKILIDQLQAETRANSVNAENATENLFEIRRLTGFTWNRLAQLLNVDRRTLNNWAEGIRIREKNRNHIAETLGVLRFIDRGTAELNSSALNEHNALHEPNSFEAIRTGDYEIAKQRLSPGVSRPYEPQTGTHGTPLYGEFQPMVMYPNADGKEMFEPLADEPEPTSRERQIKRG